MRTIRDIRDATPTNADAGLDPAAVLESRQRFGANRLTPLPREPLWKKFLDKFDEPIIKVLLAAALLSMFVDLFSGNPVAAVVSLAIVGLVVAGLLIVRRSAWLPSLMFVSALAIFLLALAVPPHHPSVEGLAVMVAVILATGVASSASTRATASSRCSTPTRIAARQSDCAAASSTRCRSKRSWLAIWCRWRWATKSPPTAGWSRRPTCTSISR